MTAGPDGTSRVGTGRCGDELRDVAVILSNVAVTAGLGWWFFGPKVDHRNGRDRGYQGATVTMRNIGKDLVLPLGSSTAGIQISAGLLYPLVGVVVSPMVAAARSASSLSVATDANRLGRTGIARLSGRFQAGGSRPASPGSARGSRTPEAA